MHAHMYTHNLRVVGAVYLTTKCVVRFCENPEYQCMNTCICLVLTSLTLGPHTTLCLLFDVVVMIASSLCCSPGPFLPGYSIIRWWCDHRPLGLYTQRGSGPHQGGHHSHQRSGERPAGCTEWQPDRPFPDVPWGRYLHGRVRIYLHRDCLQ